MGLGNALRRVYRFQALNLIRLCKSVFWAFCFFYTGWACAAYRYAAPEITDWVRTWSIVVFSVAAVIGFLLKLWEWRLSRPISDEGK